MPTLPATPPDQFSPELRESLVRLARRSDRTTPAVFAGREDELGLLDLAVQGTQEGEVGHTVVIKGVPGAGKTTLLKEYASRRLLADDDGERVVVPVPLQPEEVDATPEALVQTVDRKFREFNELDQWRKRADSWQGKAALVANVLFAAATRKRFGEFLKPAKSPDSLPAALEDYMAFKLDKRPCTLVLLVDEAQNLNDSDRVRRHLSALHGGIQGQAQVLLACFGLADTDARLADLGLSRLARDHVRTIGTLSPNAAKEVVYGTIERGLNSYKFGDGPLNETAQGVDRQGDSDRPRRERRLPAPPHQRVLCPGGSAVARRHRRRAANRCRGRRVLAAQARVLRGQAAQVVRAHHGVGACVRRQPERVDADRRCGGRAGNGGQPRRARRAGHRVGGVRRVVRRGIRRPAGDRLQACPAFHGNPPRGEADGGRPAQQGDEGHTPSVGRSGGTT